MAKQKQTARASKKPGRVLLVGSAAKLQKTLAESYGLEAARIEAAAGGADTLRRLRGQAFGVVVTDPETSIEEDLSLQQEIHQMRPGVRTILLAPSRTPEDVIAALRAKVFACFAAPIDEDDLASMVRRGVEEVDWRDGIEVGSATADWISLRVDCRLVSAERVVHFLGELRTELPDEVRDDVMLAFREILLNAMEHGGGFDPGQVVELSAVRTERTVVYHVKDPGAGFRRETLEHAAEANPDEDPLAHEKRRQEEGLRPGGYGLLLAQHIVDELILNESGNEVLLIKHLR
jgi:anti-sigma regulatory factor (Ser/Thr protein kinase)/ActR/RegA family two-component response regulator